MECYLSLFLANWPHWIFGLLLGLLNFASLLWQGRVLLFPSSQLTPTTKLFHLLDFLDNLQRQFSDGLLGKEFNGCPVLFSLPSAVLKAGMAFSKINSKEFWFFVPCFFLGYFLFFLILIYFYYPPPIIITIFICKNSHMKCILSVFPWFPFHKNKTAHNPGPLFSKAVWSLHVAVPKRIHSLCPLLVNDEDKRSRGLYRPILKIWDFIHPDHSWTWYIFFFFFLHQEQT